jgi:hypothetical protein
MMIFMILLSEFSGLYILEPVGVQVILTNRKYFCFPNCLSRSVFIPDHDRPMHEFANVAFDLEPIRFP